MKLLNPIIPSSQVLPPERAISDISSPTWSPLYRVAALAALLVVAFVPVQSVVYVVSPPPDTVSGWFDLFHRNAMLGLIDLDLLMVVDTVLGAVLMLALAVVLWRTAPAMIALAGLFEILSAASFFSSNPAFSMLALSSNYRNATTDAERERFLAAGEAMMSTWNGTSYLVFYMLGAVATLLLSIVMLRSTTFSPITGWAGVITGVLMLWPPVTTLFLIISFLSLIPMVVWFILVARQLLRLANSDAASRVMGWR